jgi:hypothetical protein
MLEILSPFLLLFQYVVLHPNEQARGFVQQGGGKVRLGGLALVVVL